MNAELGAVGEQRIVIPIVYRDNYLQGLRALSRNANPQPLIRVLDFAQAYAAAIDWSEPLGGRAGSWSRPTRSSLPTRPTSEA